jgi:hypothetical protein
MSNHSAPHSQTYYIIRTHVRRLVRNLIIVGGIVLFLAGYIMISNADHAALVAR